MIGVCSLPEFYSHSEPIAKKVHRCCECTAPIDIGEQHFHCCGKWDGDFLTHRQHLACMEACMLIRDAFGDGECVGFGSLMEEWGEMKGEESYFVRNDELAAENWQKLRNLIAKIKRRERRKVP